MSVCPLCSYIRFSTICANAVRAALKPQAKSEAMKAAEATVKVFKPKTACKLTFEYVYYSLFVPNVMYCISMYQLFLRSPEGDICGKHLRTLATIAR